MFTCIHNLRTERQSLELIAAVGQRLELQEIGLLKDLIIIITESLKQFLLFCYYNIIIISVGKALPNYPLSLCASAQLRNFINIVVYTIYWYIAEIIYYYQVIIIIIIKLNFN
jgi:hypothetical protein